MTVLETNKYTYRKEHPSMSHDFKKLEDFNKNDIPYNKSADETSYQQYVPNEKDFIDAFGENARIEDVWDKIHVFVQEDIQTGRRLFLLGPIVVDIVPRRFLGFKLNRLDLVQRLDQVIEISDSIELTQKESDDVKNDLIHRIIEGDVPWSKSLNTGILIQNDMNRIYKIVSDIIPEVRNLRLKVEPLAKVFNEMYSIT